MDDGWRSGPTAGFMRWAMVAGLGLLAGVPWLLVWGDVPDPLATHFGAGGEANGHMGHPVALGFLGGGVVVAMVWLRLAQRRHDRQLTATAMFFGAVFAVVSLLTARANEGVARWEDAELPLWLLVFPTIGAAGLAALAAALEPSKVHDVAPSGAPRLPLRASDRVAWLGRARGGWVLWFPLVLSGILSIASLGHPLVALGPFAAFLACFGFGAVRVRVSERGVLVRPWLVSWPHVELSLDDIEGAQAVHINPLEWGGWGYRGSLRLSGRAAWVLRRGDALVLELTRGRRFAVTVDGADEAAAVVNGLLARSTTVS